MCAVINLNYYDNKDFYVYNSLHNINYDIVEKHINDVKAIPYEHYYFFSSQRANFLKWYSFKKNSEILEVNACIGGLTEFLCTKAKHVTAVEFSLNNAEIIKKRLCDKENLEILVGKLNNIRFNRKFDYIILTDVIELAKVFFDTKNPYLDFIEYFKKLLNKDGEIILSLSNKFGLKNWSGTTDEHSHRPYEAIQNYPNFNFIKAFSESEIKKIINLANFKNVDFYYPTPNHYFASEILTDKYINNLDKFDLDGFSIFLLNKPQLKQSQLVSNLVATDKLKFFMNSFLIILSNKKNNSKIIYSKINNYDVINIEKNIETGEKTARKILLNNKYSDIFENIYKYYIYESKRLEKDQIKNIKLVKCKKEGNELIFDFAKGKRMDLIADDLIYKHDKKALQQLFQEYKNMVYEMYPNRINKVFSTKNENLTDFFGIIETQNSVECVKNANVDLNLSNIFKNNDEYTIIDYDTICPEYIPINYVVFKGLSTLKNPYQNIIKEFISEAERIVYKKMMVNFYKRKQEYFNNINS